MMIRGNPRSVKCPRCNAEPNEPCRGPKAWFIAHPERFAALRTHLTKDQLDVIIKETALPGPLNYAGPQADLLAHLAKLAEMIASGSEAPKRRR